MPRRVLSMNFFRRLSKRGRCFFLICIVSIRTRRYKGGRFWKFRHTIGSCWRADRIFSSMVKPSDDILGSTARPASVMRPSRSMRRHRSLFSSDHWLFFVRGANRWYVSPFSRFKVLSIQPKHIASSTASIYQNVPSSIGRPRLTFTQHSFSVAWCVMSHWRNSSRLFLKCRP